MNFLFNSNGHTEIDDSSYPHIAVGRKLCRVGGGGDDKENFFERHYFLRLQKPFSRKVGGGGGGEGTAPRFLRH